MIISRDKSLLYPPFAEKLVEFESRLAAAKLPFYLFMGLRTFEDQDELYAQGRTKPGRIVTNAPAIGWRESPSERWRFLRWTRSVAGCWIFPT